MNIVNMLLWSTLGVFCFFLIREKYKIKKEIRVLKAQNKLFEAVQEIDKQIKKTPKEKISTSIKEFQYSAWECSYIDKVFTFKEFFKLIFIFRLFVKHFHFTDKYREH